MGNKNSREKELSQRLENKFLSTYDLQSNVIVDTCRGMFRISINTWEFTDPELSLKTRTYFAKNLNDFEKYFNGSVGPFNNWNNRFIY